MPDDAPARRVPPVLVRPLPILLGILSGLGTAILLQQYAVTPLTIALLVWMGLAGGVVIGIGLPTLFLHTMKPKTEEPGEAE